VSGYSTCLVSIAHYLYQKHHPISVLLIIIIIIIVIIIIIIIYLFIKHFKRMQYTLTIRETLTLFTSKRIRNILCLIHMLRISS